MTDEPGSLPVTDDRTKALRLTRLAEALLAAPGTPARAELDGLLREIEAEDPGFAARLGLVPPPAVH